ncbi:MAG TPA: MFS transporter [Nocardioidaceae bacterium]|nr:MFS transporter [Nocardioidaceae bacterium]
MDSTAVDSARAVGGEVRRRRALTVGLCTAVVAVAFEAISVATAMPAAARELDGLDLYAWAFSLFLIGQLFATVAAGRVADRIGPARPMAGGLVLFAAGLVVAATAATMVQLVVGRLLQGLGAGVVSVAMYVVIAQVYDERQRPRMFSYISSAWVVPSFVGPGVAAWLTHHLDWRAVFWAVLPLLAVGAVMMLPPVLRSANTPARAGHRSARPAALWAAGLAALGAAAIQLGGQHLSPVGLLIGVVGIALVGLSLPNLMPRGFFRFGPGLAPVILVRTLIAGAFFGAEAFVPLMLVEQRHLSLLVAGTTLTVGALGWSVGSWLQSLRSLRLRRDRIITAGALCVLTCVALVAVVAWLQPWVGLVAIGWTVGGMGMGLATSSTSLATMALSESVEQGRNASSLQFGEAFGGGLFVGIGGTVFAALRPTGDLTVVFGSVLSAMSAVAVLAVLASLRTGPIRSAVSSP